MAITIEQREEITALVVGMFNAAPGTTYLTLMVNAIDDGATLAQLADVLEARPEFESVYPNFATSEEFAAELVANLLGSEVSAEATAWSTDWVETQINAGMSKAEVILTAIQAIRATENTNYTNAKAELENKVAVATYYSVDKEQSSADLAELQDVLTGVTSDDATVIAANAAIDADIDGNSGLPFTLTVGADAIVGTTGNDTIKSLSINDAGVAATTLSAFDTIDGGAGTDTLNIYTDNAAAFNNALPATTTISNVEIVNVYNTNTAAAFSDASKFAGVTELWQHNSAAAVTNLAATTTAGFSTIDDSAGAVALSVAATATATSASVALSAVDDGNTLTVGGAALNAVNISGTVVDGVDALTTVNRIALTVNAAATATAVTLNTAVGVTATFTGAALTSYDASASTGAVATTGGAAIASIKTGTGADTVTIATATSATVSAVVESGAGNDTVNLSTAAGTGIATVTTADGDDTVNVNSLNTGTSTITTGAGDDTVAVTARAGKLVVDMGEGDDTFTSAVAVAVTDSIDAGAGTDTLRLSLVGAANVGAFANFDVYDVVGMTGALDLDILNVANVAAEIVGSAALTGATTLQNVAAGVNFRATGDMALVNALTLTQKTAGALTVTLDADETTADAIDDVASAAVAATNATSVSAVFDTAYLAAAGAVAGETAATDNISTINLTTTAATAVTVVSGGTNAQNVLNLTDAGLTKVASLTITGTQDLMVLTATTGSLNTIDASGSTGGLEVSTDSLKNAGTITLGTGTDVVQVGAASLATAAGVEAIAGFEKTAAVSISVLPADAVAAAAAIAVADELDLGAATVATATVVAGGSIATTTGALTFDGAGPATLDAAFAIADLAAETVGEAVVFEYIGNSYVFVQGATDLAVKLVGVTGVTNLVLDAGTSDFFVV